MPTKEASDVPGSGHQCNSLRGSDLRRWTAPKLVNGVRRHLCKSYFPWHHPVTCAALIVLMGLATPSEGGGRPEPVRLTRQAQQVVDDLRQRLGIAAPVFVTLVDREPRAMSVRASRERRGTFELAVDRRFAVSLPVAQLEAALAHELGHVWISTNHPYLQTEQLANAVAMRVVARERLVEVYRTLWGADAVHGSLETFLGVSTGNRATGAR